MQLSWLPNSRTHLHSRKKPHAPHSLSVSLVLVPCKPLVSFPHTLILSGHFLQGRLTASCLLSPPPISSVLSGLTHVAAPISASFLWLNSVLLYRHPKCLMHWSVQGHYECSRIQGAAVGLMFLLLWGCLSLVLWICNKERISGSCGNSVQSSESWLWCTHLGNRERDFCFTLLFYSQFQSGPFLPPPPPQGTRVITYS